MRKLLLTSAAVAALAIGMPAVHAQRGQDNIGDRSPAAGASQPSSPQADQRGGRGSPREGQSSGQTAQPQRGTPADNQMRAADESRQQRGNSGARAQDDDTRRGRAEGKPSEQTGERASEQRQDRDRPQRDEARDNRRDRADQERSRTTGERSGDRDRDNDRADRNRERDRERADRGRADGDRDRADRNRDRDSDRADRNRDRERERTTTGQSRDDRANESRRSNDSTRSDDNNRRDRDRADRGRDTRSGSVSLSQDQRVRIGARFSDRIDRLNVRTLPRSRVSVSVGVVVPSAITLYDVPTEIVEIYPAFRSHKFVVVEDEIVIIEPRSRKIVTTISRSGERSASRSTTGVAPAGSRVRLRDEDRTVIRTVITRQAECRLEHRLDFTIGLPLPRTVEICEFPEEIVAQVPEVRSYRYVVRGDDIVLVDPDEHRIVEVID